MTDHQRRLLVTLYVHPAADPHPWRVLERAAGRLYRVILNRADGPGIRPDPVFAEAAARLRAAGAPLLGYVDTAYGRRRVGAVLTDVRRHRRWYGVDGVFLDRTAAHAATLPRSRRLALASRVLGARTVVFNPGTHPDPRYAALADLLVTFEGRWDTYRQAEVPDWTAAHPPGRFCHRVYDMPGGRAGQVGRTARARGAAVHCALPGAGANPWRSAPDELEEAPR
ncbi:spherulation-specific family 4 protein [Streptomyces botrytidirepellens]|uniref:Spherulation-specific family 4 protein n=1 Tax=Streptomyces botrytidirepellens TaxID=2486417 RepID=A0A3M8UI09_9ACTN|nr:spherulation-specific family 4 protein [Streptomyces botrytidirepellens]RNG03805.1 hypothetical protein EEJ42_34360 [Streptomyces botrytidirepellens]